MHQLTNWESVDKDNLIHTLIKLKSKWEDQLDLLPKRILEGWDDLASNYAQDELEVQVRGKSIKNALFTTSLSGLKIQRVAIPKTNHAGERLKFALKENIPGYFPFTAGVFPFKREGEDPTRMFAGEGTPERTNKRLLCECRFTSLFIYCL